MLSLLQLDPQTYRPHALHDPARAYPETNCYADILIELVHARGDEPLAMLGGTIRTDFEGDQWTFFKPAPQDLERLFGIDIHEMQLYRPLPDQIEEQLRAGRTVIVELDSWFLPDTQSTAYRREHVKSSAVIEGIDPDAERLRYFHNTGLFELSGDDFRGSLRLDDRTAETSLPPYLEIVRFDAGQRLTGDALKEASRSLFGEHFSHRPGSNPFERFRDSLAAHLPSLLASDHAYYHTYAFATVRMAGSAFEACASHVEWLFGADGADAAAVAGDDHGRLKGAVVQAGTPSRVRRRRGLRTTRRCVGRRDRCSVETPRLMSSQRLDSWQLATTPAATFTTPPGPEEVTWRQVRLPVRGSDGDDHWFRHELRATGASPVVQIGGLASVSDVYLDGALVLRSDSMFVSHTLTVSPGAHELVVCARALDPLLKIPRKPRARWRSNVPRDGNLRWFRTTLLGRAPGFAPGPPLVGPWRDVWLAEQPALRACLRTRMDGGEGVLQVETDVGARAARGGARFAHDDASGRRRRGAGARPEPLVAAHARRSRAAPRLGSARPAANWCGASAFAS